MLPWKDPLLLGPGLQTPSSPLEWPWVSWCWDGASLPSPLSNHNSLGYLITEKGWVKFTPRVRKERFFGNSFSAQPLRAHPGCNGAMPYPRYLEQFNFLFQEQTKHSLWILTQMSGILFQERKELISIQNKCMLCWIPWLWGKSLSLMAAR